LIVRAGKDATPGLDASMQRFLAAAGARGVSIELVDLADAPLRDPDTPAPVRFLAHFDNALLVHFRRTGILPEEHRPRIFSIRNPFSVGTVLVDGRVAATWSLRDDRIAVEMLEEVDRRNRDAIEDERAALEDFHR
jgi:hypothetical protein